MPKTFKSFFLQLKKIFKKMKNFSCIFVLNMLLYLMFVRNVLVAQLDRVFGYEPKGRGFESLQARHIGAKLALLRFFYAEIYPPAFLLLLFRKKAHPARLFACKRSQRLTF